MVAGGGGAGAIGLDSPTGNPSSTTCNDGGAGKTV